MNDEQSGQSKSKSEAAGSGKKCPVCSARVRAEAEAFPFCSARCRKIDMGRWMNETYRISRSIEEADLEEGVD